MKALTIKTLVFSEVPIIRVFHRLNYRKNPDFIKGKNSDEGGELKAKVWARYESMITQMVKETRVRTFYQEKSIEIKKHEVIINEYGFVTIELNRTGRYIGRRFSCGYGDFSLNYQQFFYEILEFEKYGIKINDKNILFPEKTVTALLPVFPAGESK
jgi:hypothetical protein